MSPQRRSREAGASRSEARGRLQRVVSGGQTGVDRAALDAARASGLAIGGWCPRGRRAEDGSLDPSYPLAETPSGDPRQRTRWNVRDSDATLILARGPLQGGTAYTKACAQRAGKPLLVVDLRDPPPLGELRDWLDRHRVAVLNVAGPRESQSPGIYWQARALLEALLAPPGQRRERANRFRHAIRRPHLIGVDDGPFEKHRQRETTLVGVVMEGADLVEGVAVTRFPVDGSGATEFLAEWIGGLRFRPALQGVLLGGVTLAGLAVVDVPRLAETLGLPVLVVNRQDPARHRLERALRAAGLEERMEAIRRCPEAFRVGERLFVACAGAAPEEAARLLEASRRKSDLPEPLRLAHLIARALVLGESRGRP